MPRRTARRRPGQPADGAARPGARLGLSVVWRCWLMVLPVCWRLILFQAGGIAACRAAHFRWYSSTARTLAGLGLVVAPACRGEGCYQRDHYVERGGERSDVPLDLRDCQAAL